jgi:hypothetical protein
MTAGVAREPSLPQSVADQHDLARLVFDGAQRTPNTVRMPSIGKHDAVMRAPSTRSGSSSPPMFH